MAYKAADEEVRIVADPCFTDHLSFVCVLHIIIWLSPDDVLKTVFTSLRPSFFHLCRRTLNNIPLTGTLTHPHTLEYKLLYVKVITLGSLAQGQEEFYLSRQRCDKRTFSKTLLSRTRNSIIYTNIFDVQCAHTGQYNYHLWYACAFGRP